MKIKKLIAIVLSLALTAVCIVPAYAEETLQVQETEEKKLICVRYYAEADSYYGAPNVINPAATQEVEAGVEFELAENLKTDSILATDPQTGEFYLGKWEFSGWFIPAYVCTREIETEPDTALGEEYAAIIEETETKLLCTSSLDVEFIGSWQFTPEEKLTVPEKIETDSTLPLSGTYDALSRFWPEREAALNRVYATGLFPASIIRYMDKNIREIPIQSKDFSSIELSEAERIGFINSVQQTYETVISGSKGASEILDSIQSIIASTDSINASADTAFVVYCGEKAGMVEGKSKSLIKTADIAKLYDFLKNDACADFISSNDLLQIYSAEDGEVVEGITLNDTSVDFAHEEGWYDVSNSKNIIQPGDLIVFEDAQGTPMSVGIIDSVEGRSITYVICISNGMFAEYTLEEDDIRALSEKDEDIEIIGLRVCDPSRIVYEFLVNEMKLPTAAALGIMGNLYYESRFSTTSLGDGNTSFGLCQWHNDRFLNLVIFCMKNNYNIASLEGQLKFLAYELNQNYPGLIVEFSQCGETASWAKETAYRFCQVFEQPANIELNGALRGTMASGPIWDSYSELFFSVNKLENIKLAKELVDNISEQHTEYVLYAVKKGDCLSSICWSLGVNYDKYKQEVLTINNIDNEHRVLPGQVLTILIHDD